MQEIKYYPLIDCDSAGTEKTPMFFSDDEDTVRQSHEMYLQERLFRSITDCVR